KPLALLAPYAGLLDSDRALSARFRLAMEDWREGHVGDAELARVLRQRLLPEWDRARNDGPSPLGRPQFGRPVLPQLRAQRERPGGRGGAKGPPTEAELRQAVQLYAQARAEAWQGLASALEGGLAMDNLLDQWVVEMMRERLDEMANEANPLHEWF